MRGGEGERRREAGGALMPPADFLCFTSLFAWLRLTRFDVCAASSQVDSQRRARGGVAKGEKLQWRQLEKLLRFIVAQTLRRVTKSGSHY